jgi:hypothetical protein
MLLHANTITGNTIAFPFFVSLRRCLEIVIYWVKQESRIVIYMTPALIEDLAGKMQLSRRHEAYCLWEMQKTCCL